jgi:hypothetical protein
VHAEALAVIELEIFVMYFSSIQIFMFCLLAIDVKIMNIVNTLLVGN